MALAANTLINFVNTTEWRHYPVLADQTIYKGGFVGLTAAGYARALTAGDLFIGVATDKVVEEDSTNGSVNVEVDARPFEFTLSSVAVTDVGRPVYASADDTLTFAASGNSYVGTVARYVTTNTAVIQPDIAVLTPVKNMAVKTLSATGAQTLTAHDRNKVIFIPNTAAFTLTLPLAATVGAGARFLFVKTSADAEAITLSRAGSDTINGGNTVDTIDAAYDTMELISDGVSAYYIHDDVS